MYTNTPGEGNGTHIEPFTEKMNISEHQGLEDCCYNYMFPTGIAWTLTIIGSFGAVANFVTIYILINSRMKIAFKTFLIGLTLFDLLSCSAAAFSLAIHDVPEWVASCLYWIFNFGLSGSIWFTLLVTGERYTAVCMPLKHLTYWTLRKIVFFISLILSMDFLVNLPLAAHLLKKLIKGSVNNEEKNFLTWWSLLLLTEFTFSALTVVMLNTLIYREIRRTDFKRRSLTSDSQRKSITSEEHRENQYTNLTVMVVCVYTCLYIYPTVALLRCPQSLMILHKPLVLH